MGIQDEDSDFDAPEAIEIDLCAQTIKEFVKHPVFEGVIFISILANVIMMVILCSRCTPYAYDGACHEHVCWLLVEHDAGDRRARAGAGHLR
jgi:hypothetical protein